MQITGNSLQIRLFCPAFALFLSADFVLSDMRLSSPRALLVESKSGLKADFSTANPTSAYDTAGFGKVLI